MADETPLSAAEIYDKVTGGSGTGELGHTQDSARQLREQMADRAEQVVALGREIGEGWQGPAGEAAAGAAMPLARAAEADADNLGVAESAIGQQMTDFGTVYNSVTPVSPTMPEMTDAQLVSAIFGGDTSGYYREVADWRADSRQNVQAFANYHQASMSNGEQLPTMYEPLVDPGYPITMSSGSSMPMPGGGSAGSTGYQPGGTGPSTVPPPSYPTVRPGDSVVPTTFNPPPSDPTPGDYSVNTPAASTSPSSGDSDSTSAASFIPPSYTQYGPPGSTYGPSGFGSADDYRGTNIRGSAFGPVGGGTTGGYGGSYAPRGGGVGSGYSPSSGGAYRTGGLPGTTGGTPTSGPGRSTGAIPYSSSTGARVGSFTSGSGGGSATTGRGMMPMGAGAGRGQGGEDEQHERKTPYSENPFELFPQASGTVPPVIGESKPNDQR